MKRLIIGVLGLIFLLSTVYPVLAVEGNLTISDREIIERLTRLEEGQTAINLRIDDLRSELKGDIQDLRGLMYVVLGGMIALIGFVIWDRRSAISPVINRTKELEDDRDRTLRVLRGYAQKEPKLAEVMKSLGLM